MFAPFPSLCRNAGLTTGKRPSSSYAPCPTVAGVMQTGRGDSSKEERGGAKGLRKCLKIEKIKHIALSSISYYTYFFKFLSQPPIHSTNRGRKCLHPLSPSFTRYALYNKICARSCDREIVALSVNYCPKRVALVRKFVKGKERGGAAWIGLSDLSMYYVAYPYQQREGEMMGTVSVML